MDAQRTRNYVGWTEAGRGEWGCMSTLNAFSLNHWMACCYRYNVCVKLRVSNHVLGKAGTAAGLVTASYQAGQEGEGNIETAQLTRVSETGQAKHKLHVSLVCLSALGCTCERE